MNNQMTLMTNGIQIVTRFKSAQDGAISIIFAILLPIVVGFIALATDAGVWYIDQRNLQSTADVSALTAVRQNDLTNSATLLSIATNEGARHGFTAANQTSFTVNAPPLSGSYMGNANAVEVILSQTQPRFFSVLHTGNDPVANARAVAKRQESKNACVLALDEHADESIDFSGSPSVGLTNCVIAANSDSENAININGNVNLTAQSLYMVGGYTTTGQSYTMTLQEEAITHASPVNDPYADTAEPSYGGCNYTNTRASGTRTLSPGVYCGDLIINANSNVTFQPGTYYIHEGQFKVNGNTTIVGDGVTFVLTGSGSNIATIDMNGSANVNLTAPSTGTYAGMLMYQDRDAPTSGVNRINGSIVNNIKGSLYFPNQRVEFSGNSGNTSSCLRLVARMVTFSGNSGFAHNCDTVGGENVVTEYFVQLVE